MSMYLRLKRNNETIFQHCEPSDKLQTIKEKVALIVGVDEDDVMLFETLTPEKLAILRQQQTQERAQRLAKQVKELGAAAANAAAAASSTSDFVQPALDCEKKIGELGLSNDAVVRFAIRIE